MVPWPKAATSVFKHQLLQKKVFVILMAIFEHTPRQSIRVHANSCLLSHLSALSLTHCRSNTHYRAGWCKNISRRTTKAHNLPLLKQQSPILHRIQHLIICNVLKTQYLPPHKQTSSISHKSCLFIWKYLWCEGKPASIRNPPWYGVIYLYEKPPRTQNAT